MRHPKKQIALLALTTSFVLVLSSLTLSQSSFGFDTTPPSVESCEIDIKSIPATGGEVNVKAQFKSVNDLDRTPPVIRMFNKSYDRFIADVKFGQLSSGDKKYGTWTWTFMVLTDRKPDRYYVYFDPLWDTGGNSNRTSFMCENAYVDYGGYIPSTPTPSPTPSAKATAKPTPVPTVYVTNPADATLADSIKSLKSQLSKLNSKLKKICAAKPKPKGC